MQPLEILLSDEDKDFIGVLTESGRGTSSDEVIMHALQLLREHEAVREWKLGELRRLIEEGQDSGPVELWDAEAFKVEARERAKPLRKKRIEYLRAATDELEQKTDLKS